MAVDFLAGLGAGFIAALIFAGIMGGIIGALLMTLEGAFDVGFRKLGDLLTVPIGVRV